MHANLHPLNADLTTCFSASASTSSRIPKPSTTSSNSTPRCDDFFPSVPSELVSYTTTTTSAHEVYSSILDTRDRRLRLLIRRFINQIQSGCKNPHCEVATCLSYRKRHATRPVRPYSDVVARALAWRCVEEYGDGGKVGRISDDTVGDRKRKGKGKTATKEKGDGLCWSEPVIPWYADPADYDRKRIKSDAQPNGRVSPRAIDKEPLQHVGVVTSTAVSSDEKRRMSLKSDKEVESLSKTHGVSTHCKKNYEKKSRNTSESQQSINDVIPYSNGHTVRPDSASQMLDLAGDRHIDRPVSKTDPAAFTQTLYGTSSLRSFDIERMNPAPIKGNTSRPVSEMPLLNRGTNTEAQQVFRGGTTSRQQVCTFKLLPLSAIVWLRNSVLRQAKVAPDLNVQGASLDEFARQSLYYCLSDPFRLMKSAHTWRFSEISDEVLDEPYDEKASLKLESTIKEMTIKEQEVLRSFETPRLPSHREAVPAFAMLSVLGEPYETVDHVFAALQHAYILPTWLEKSRLRPRKDHGSMREVRNPFPNMSVIHDKARSASPRVSSLQFLDDRQVAHLCMLAIWALILQVELKMCSPFNSPEDNFLPNIGYEYNMVRNSGWVFHHSFIVQAHQDDPERAQKFRCHILRMDAHDDWNFQRLLESFADIISHRLAISEAEKTTRSPVAPAGRSKSIVDLLIGHLLKARRDSPEKSEEPHSTTWAVLDMMRHILLKKWDRRAIVKKNGPVGGALQMLAGMYRSRADLCMNEKAFAWKFIADAFDDVEMPLNWLSFREDSIYMHLMSFSFLFEPATLVKYFRAINIETMKKAYDQSSVVYQDVRQFLVSLPIPVYGTKDVLSVLRPYMGRYTVLTISREHLVEDAINQIWRRQRQELMRPLKVRLGKDEGEEGLDHGGVQQEFFRAVFAEALQPDYGMFTIDDTTRMTWFQPGSVEQLYKFEALGILMSLAVYNAITLPVTFPLAFYRKLLGLKVKSLEHIQDGWQELSKGLRTLLEWEDGDVGDVMTRTYEFSYDAFGTAVSVDMSSINRDDPWPPLERKRTREKVKTTSFEFPASQSPTSLMTPPSETESDIASAKFSLSSRSAATSLSSVKRKTSQELTGTATPVSMPPSNPSTPLLISPSTTPPPAPPVLPSPPSLIEAPLVTNSNRAQYIKDYIHWLTNKSISPQFTAFHRGFHSLLTPTALSIFTPTQLKHLIEGSTTAIDIEALERTAATYDDYTPTEPYMADFWSVVRDFSPDQHKKLLEFVTASDRVPVNGIGSVTFIVQRNGEGDERLPSSSTCYGRLLLPRYSSKEVLRTKLEKAVENSVGFGSL